MQACGGRAPAVSWSSSLGQDLEMGGSGGGWLPLNDARSDARSFPHTQHCLRVTGKRQIMLADKEAQFHLGHDDTALENLMKRLRSTHRRTRGTGECKDVEEHKDEKECVPLRMGLEDGAGLPTTVEEALPGEPMNTPTVAPQPQRLGNFLRRVCVVMETLCEENLSSVAARGGLGIHDPEDEEDGEDVGGGKRSLFPGGGASNDGWEEVGANDAAGLESLIGSAAVVGIAFSRAKRSMLVTAHARPMRREVTVTGGDAGSSERNPAAEGLEGCGVVCVWNSEAPMVKNRECYDPICVCCGLYCATRICSYIESLARDLGEAFLDYSRKRHGVHEYLSICS